MEEKIYVYIIIIIIILIIINNNKNKHIPAIIKQIDEYESKNNSYYIFIVDNFWANSSWPKSRYF